MWNKLQFLFSSVFRRFQLLLGSLAVILLAVFLPLSASAETVNIKPTFSDASLNYLSAEVGFPFGLTNILDNQYTYGGLYNPLIMIGGSSKWQTGICSVRWNFGKTLPAGTVLSIQCGGWHNQAYPVEDKFMYVSLTPPTSEVNLNAWTSERTELITNSVGHIQTSNGVYFGYLYSGSYTLPSDSSYIYLVFQVNLSSQRTSGLAFGQHCNSIRYEANHVSPAESDVYGTPESGSFDDTSTAIGNAESAENALISGGDSAITGAFDSLTSSVNSLNAFVSGFVFVQRLCSSLVSSLPFLNVLIPISVGLGLFAMLIGVIGSVVSRSKGGGKDDSSG